MTPTDRDPDTPLLAALLAGQDKGLWDDYLDLLGDDDPDPGWLVWLDE